MLISRLGEQYYTVMLYMDNTPPDSNTNFLSERIKQNEANQTLNLNDWAFSLIASSEEKYKILELCCGTGRQTEYLLKHYPNSHITCLDISMDALSEVKKSHFYDEKRLKLIRNDMDLFLQDLAEKYDIIFVSYGLYYARDVGQVMNAIKSSISNNGTFIVLAPYGDNNKELFDLCINAGASVPEFVRYSCTDFMIDEVIRRSIGSFSSIKLDMIKNAIKWSSVEEIVSYWKNSTFFYKERENVFIEKLNDFFKNNSQFINTKHIMLFQATR